MTTEKPETVLLKEPAYMKDRWHIKAKNRQYLKKAPRRIAAMEEQGYQAWAEAIRAKCAEIVTATLLKQWPYDE